MAEKGDRLALADFSRGRLFHGEGCFMGNSRAECRSCFLRGRTSVVRIRVGGDEQGEQGEDDDGGEHDRNG